MTLEDLKNIIDELITEDNKDLEIYADEIQFKSVNIKLFETSYIGHKCIGINYMEG